MTICCSSPWIRQWLSVGLLCVVLAAPALARKNLPPERPTPAEMTMLPPECAARIGGDEATRQLWAQRLGPKNFLHLHHYCFGLNYNNRARLTQDKGLRKYFLQRADANFDYVLEHWPAESPLRRAAEAGKMQTHLMQQMP